MNSSVGGVAHVSSPVAADTAGEAIPGVARRAAAFLACEPFVLLAVAVDALVLTFRLPDLVASDTWLALVSGRYVSNHWIPHHETLTIWSHGVTWVDQQWLGQLFFYWIHAVGGFRLLLFVHAAVLVAAFALAVGFSRRSGASARSVGVVGAVAVFVAFPNSAVRTQAFAYLLFVLLFRLLASEARMPSRQVLLALPLVVVWANVHGSAALGAGLVVVWAFSELVRARLRPGAGWLRVRAITLAAAAPLCLLVSPYGSALPGYYRHILSSGAFRDVVAEWRPTTFPDQWPFFALALASLWLAARKPKRLSLFEHLALLCTVVAGLDGLRYIAWFALIAVMVVPRALDDVWPAGQAPLRRRVNIALSIGALAVLVGSFSVAAARPSGWYTRGYPPGAADAVAAVTARDPSLRVFSNEGYADWLLWKVPRLSGHVAFDARFELLSAEQLQAISHFRNQNSTNWLDSANGYRLLVLDPRSEEPAVQAVGQVVGTTQLFQDDRIAVLLRGADR